jgi:hypothetical protein
MSERFKPHNGRDGDGNRKVRKADVDDLVTDPEGVDYLRDDVRLGGAVEDIGPHAGKRGARITELVQENRENISRAAKTDTESEPEET